jgi:hypothetical protein
MEMYIIQQKPLLASVTDSIGNASHRAEENDNQDQ